MDLQSDKIKKLSRHIIVIDREAWHTPFSSAQIEEYLKKYDTVITNSGIAVNSSTGTPLFEVHTNENEFHLKISGFVKEFMKLQAYGQTHDGTIKLNIGFGFGPLFTLLAIFLIKLYVVFFNPFQFPEYVAHTLVFIPVVTFATCVIYLYRLKRFLKHLFHASKKTK